MVAIGIDYTPAYEQGGGIGRYVREMIRELSLLDTTSDYRLFVAGATSNILPLPIASNFTFYPNRIHPKWWARIWHRARIPYPIENIIGDVALFHAMDFVLPPLRKKTKSLLTIHDLSFVRVPETAAPSLKRYLDAVVPRSIARADHVLAVSEATRQDIIDLYNTPPEKITVLFNGVESRFRPVTPIDKTILHKYKIPDVPYIFSIGTVQPRKNYSRLVQAIAQLREQHDVHLVIAGGRGWLEDEFYTTIHKTNMTDYVHLTGFVEDEDLPTLYSGALCVAFVSLYEGFGIPILEGMACGVPVVTGDNSSLSEVAGSAAILVDPYSPEAIRDALERVITDQNLCDTLIQKGLIQAKQFTWEKSATQLRQLYRQMIEGVI